MQIKLIHISLIILRKMGQRRIPRFRDDTHMILTLTLNPSVDFSCPLTALKLDDVNRVQK